MVSVSNQVLVTVVFQVSTYSKSRTRVFKLCLRYYIHTSCFEGWRLLDTFDINYNIILLFDFIWFWFSFNINLIESPYTKYLSVTNISFLFGFYCTLCLLLTIKYTLLPLILFLLLFFNFWSLQTFFALFKSRNVLFFLRISLLQYWYINLLQYFYWQHNLSGDNMALFHNPTFTTVSYYVYGDSGIYNS